VAGVDAVVVFLAALAGAVIGAYGGLTVERLREGRELDLRRHEDIKEGLLALNEQAAGALRICADLEATDHWPALYDEDWRKLRAKQLPGRAADMLIAWSRVDVLLPNTSILEQRVSEYFDVLVAPDDAGNGAGEGRLPRAAAAHTELKNAIRDHLARDHATPEWPARARRILSPSEWRARASSFGSRRAGE
jgi:hypothetical protein